MFELCPSLISNHIIHIVSVAQLFGPISGHHWAIDAIRLERHWVDRLQFNRNDHVQDDSDSLDHHGCSGHSVGHSFRQNSVQWPSPSTLRWSIDWWWCNQLPTTMWLFIHWFISWLLSSRFNSNPKGNPGSN